MLKGRGECWASGLGFTLECWALDFMPGLGVGCCRFGVAGVWVLGLGVGVFVFGGQGSAIGMVRNVAQGAACFDAANIQQNSTVNTVAIFNYESVRCSKYRESPIYLNGSIYGKL